MFKQSQIIYTINDYYFTYMHIQFYNKIVPTHNSILVIGCTDSSCNFLVILK